RVGLRDAGLLPQRLDPVRGGLRLRGAGELVDGAVVEFDGGGDLLEPFEALRHLQDRPAPPSVTDRRRPAVGESPSEARTFTGVQGGTTPARPVRSRASHSE